ncbi:cation:proton antiporter [Plantactinospora sp. S1510]|uniref:Cation:proton antiporter n=1 Tax=Plantactinospora alkalitolerans TaxID=2789879 RepID=A0ABS0H815_9ACTN|nr:cation:proton antiporter [Plantactinospora alkalitolerans]MBF9134459.1 cation:proton antiporter [Plantactinospora alkalitolerans]
MTTTDRASAAEPTTAGRRPKPPRRRLVAVYAGLVVVPVIAAVGFVQLDRDGDPGGSPGGTPIHVPSAGDGLGRLLLAVVIVVATAKLLGAAVRRLGQPPVIGEIAAGIALGPSALGAVWPAATAWLLSPSVMPQLAALGQLGVVLFVFLAGLKLNTRLLRGQHSIAITVSHVSIALPFLLGVGLAGVAYHRFAPGGLGFMPFALFLGISMSITALPVLARILMDTGLFGSWVGTLALTCAVVDDVTAWLLLALVVALVVAGSAAGVLTTVALTAAFVAVLWFGVRPLLWRIEAGRHGGPVPLGLVGLLLCALATEWIGVHAVFGAFLFGLVFPAESRWGRRLDDAVGGLTLTLLLPLFFASNGLRTELGLLGTDPAGWLWCALVLLVAVVGKFAGSAVAARVAGTSWPEALQIGALLNCRGLTELIVLNIGLDLGVLSPELFTMLVVMALASTAMAAPVVNRIAARPRPAPDRTPAP